MDEATMSRPTLLLTQDEKRWVQNIVLQKQLIELQVKNAHQEISASEKDCMASICGRLSINVGEYDINMQTGILTPKEKKE